MACGCVSRGQRTLGLYLRSTFAHQGQFRISTGIHSKFKVTGTKTQHGTTFTSQNWRTDEGVSKAGPRRHCHQVRTSSIFAIQCVHKGCQLFCVHFLGEESTQETFLPAPLAPHSLPFQSLFAILAHTQARPWEGLFSVYNQSKSMLPNSPYSPLPQNL